MASLWSACESLLIGGCGDTGQITDMSNGYEQVSFDDANGDLICTVDVTANGEDIVTWPGGSTFDAGDINSEDVEDIDFG